MKFVAASLLLLAAVLPRAAQAQEIGTAVACADRLGCTSHPQLLDGLEDVAAEASVDPGELLGALNALWADGIEVSARTYLFPPKPVTAPAVAAASTGGLSGRLACIARVESHNDPNATNPRSGAAGLFQFLHGTWMSTPQGKAGLSPYDPAAATAAAQWMVSQGRIREWTPVQLGMC